jgi:hypothetical protein
VDWIHLHQDSDQWRILVFVPPSRNDTSLNPPPQRCVNSRLFLVVSHDRQAPSYSAPVERREKQRDGRKVAFPAPQAVAYSCLPETRQSLLTVSSANRWHPGNALLMHVHLNARPPLGLTYPPYALVPAQRNTFTLISSPVYTALFPQSEQNF